MLAEEIEAVYADPPLLPPRIHHGLSDDVARTLLVMPVSDAQIAITKILHVGPATAQHPSIQGVCVVLDIQTGATLMVLDGAALTLARTAAASAVAARKLVGWGQHTHLIVGSGTLALPFAQAYQAICGVTQSQIWARNLNAAQSCVDQSDGRLSLVTDLEQACVQARIISTLTSARTPVIKGAWLNDPVHLDLVGSFKAEMRETDDQAVQGARIFAEPFEEAQSHCGDLADPLASGKIQAGSLAGDLSCLLQEQENAYGPAQRSVFKTVGSARMDLAAARTALRALALKSGQD